MIFPVEINIRQIVLPILKEYEWSSCQATGGGGPMHMQSDGGSSASCPVCKGIDPRDKSGSWIQEAIGHQFDCPLQALILKLEVKRL